MRSAAKPPRTFCSASSSVAKIEKFGSLPYLVTIGLAIIRGVVAAPFHDRQLLGGTRQMRQRDHADAEGGGARSMSRRDILPCAMRSMNFILFMRSSLGFHWTALCKAARRPELAVGWRHCQSMETPTSTFSRSRVDSPLVCHATVPVVPAREGRGLALRGAILMAVTSVRESAGRSAGAHSLPLLQRFPWLAGYLLLSPTILIVLVMLIAPIVALLIMSFWTQTALTSTRPSRSAITGS